MAAHDATPRADGGITGPARAARPPVEFVAGLARAVFTWQGDRWTHDLTLAAGDVDQGGSSDGGCCWQSLDGPWPVHGDPRWPASPVLVELSSVASATRSPVLVGVGMAGRSHYSASIGNDPLVADAVRFEIACRIHDGPGWLGSTYRHGQGLVRIEAAVPPGSLPRTVEWSYSIGPNGVFGIRGATLSRPGW